MYWVVSKSFDQRDNLDEVKTCEEVLSDNLSPPLKLSSLNAPTKETNRVKVVATQQFLSIRSEWKAFADPLPISNPCDYNQFLFINAHFFIRYLHPFTTS